MIVMMTGYILGAYPMWEYYLWHSIVVPFYVIIRIIYYRQNGWHYYLFDFCYWANFVILIFLNYLPKNMDIFMCSYFWAMGPFAAAIGAMRNSMIFHRIDNLTSLVIHAIPMMSMYNMRWVTIVEEAKLPEEQRYFVSLPTDGISMTTHVMAPLALYIFWAIFYSLKIFVVSPKRIKERNYETMYRYISEMPFFVVVKNIFGEKYAPIGFMIIHFGYTILSCALALLCFYN